VGGRMKQYHEIHLKKFRYENKTNNPTRKWNAEFWEKSIIKIFGVILKERMTDFNLPKEFSSCCQNSGCFTSSRWSIKQEIRELWKLNFYKLLSGTHRWKWWVHTSVAWYNDFPNREYACLTVKIC
jgi:hypothetical protein